MIRTYLHYGAESYVIGHVTEAEVRARIEEILATGAPGWLGVNYGEGQEQPASLLISPHVPIAVYEVDDGE